MQLPLNVSPVSASFIGMQRQGIHLVLCLACSFLCLLCLHLSHLHMGDHCDNFNCCLRFIAQQN